MGVEHVDLSMLSRAGEAGPGVGPAQRADAVPLPRSRWKTRLLLPGVIIAAVMGLFLYAAGDALWPATPVRVVPAMVKTGVAGGGAVTVQAPGWVEPDPFEHAVSALADGIVREVLVLEGQPVQANQVVARLVDEDARLALQSAEAELAASEAAVLTAEAALNAAQREWDNPVELTRKVSTAEAMLAEARADLQRWPAELAAEQAKAIELEAEYQRLAKLYDEATAGDIELIRATQQYKAQQATVDATRAREPIIKAQIDRFEAEVVAAKDNLRLRIPETQALESARAGLAAAKAMALRAQAKRDEAQLRLERMEVRSPVDGIVMTRLVEPGSKLMLNADMSRSAMVVRLYDPQSLQVRVDVPLADAAHVGVGQAAELVVDVLPDRVFHGRVTRVVNEADIQKNTLQVKVAIDDPSPELKPEMLARARFLAAASGEANQERQSIFVPASLIGRHGGGGGHVWLVDQTRNVAELRMVTPGTARVGDWIEILEGLQPGDRLIADDTSGLRPGARVRIVGEAAVESDTVLAAGGLVGDGTVSETAGQEGGSRKGHEQHGTN